MKFCQNADSMDVSWLVLPSESMWLTQNLSIQNGSLGRFKTVHTNSDLRLNIFPGYASSVERAFISYEFYRDLQFSGNITVNLQMVLKSFWPIYNV
jgi:hypothetical protein